MSAAKIGENTADILDCYYLLLSNYIPTFRKLNLLHINSIYLLVFSLQKQRRILPTKQSTLQVFLICPNRNDSQNFKSSSCKIFFLQCVCCRCNLLRWMFFILSDNWKTLYFLKVCCTLRFFQPPYYCFLLNKCFERSPYFTLSPQ